MIEQTTITHLAALLSGVIIGVIIAIPWRPIIRRKVQTRNITELSRQLHEAIAELERQDSILRSEPFSGSIEVPA